MKISLELKSRILSIQFLKIRVNWRPFAVKNTSVLVLARRWMPYITVDDLDAVLAKVGSLGGSVVLPPTALPEDSGRIAIITDPQGGTTGLAPHSKMECP